MKEQKQVTAEEFVSILKLDTIKSTDGDTWYSEWSLIKAMNEYAAPLQARIAELEAINSQYKKQITELNQCLSDECRYNFKLKSQRDRYREALEWVVNECYCGGPASKQPKRILTILNKSEQALNQKEG